MKYVNVCPRNNSLVGFHWLFTIICSINYFYLILKNLDVNFGIVNNAEFDKEVCIVTETFAWLDT